WLVQQRHRAVRAWLVAQHVPALRIVFEPLPLAPWRGAATRFRALAFESRPRTGGVAGQRCPGQCRSDAQRWYRPPGPVDEFGRTCGLRLPGVPSAWRGNDGNPRTTRTALAHPLRLVRRAGDDAA